VDAGPGWLRTMSTLNPLTYVVDAERALFAGSFDAQVLLAGMLSAVAVCLFGLWVGTRSMRAAD
jgi:ABC-2 type transport system permease protein